MKTPPPLQGNVSPNVEAQRIAERAGRALYDRDGASKGLGMRIVEMRPGFSRVSMLVRADMVNGHRICHGGLVFALADSAFAFACNSHGDNAIAAAASIDFLAPAREGDELQAVAAELWCTGRNGLYEVTVINQRDERIALFRGRSHRIDGNVTDLPST